MDNILEIELLKIAQDISKEDKGKNIGYTVDGVLSVYIEMKQKFQEINSKASSE